MNTKEEFYQNYIDSGFSKIIFINECVFIGRKQNAESGYQIKK